MDAVNAVLLMRSGILQKAFQHSGNQAICQLLCRGKQPVLAHPSFLLDGMYVFSPFQACDGTGQYFLTIMW